MFADLSWTHILLLIVVALVVVGPKDLPRLMGEIGRWTNKARAMAGELRASFDDMGRHDELNELRREIEALKTVRPFDDARPSITPTAVRMNDDDGASIVPATTGRMELVEAAAHS